MNLLINTLYPKFKDTIDRLREWASPNMYVYDIETYPNYFCIAIINVKTLECYYYELSDWYNNMADFSTFIYWLHDQQAEMVGFNNQHFDWPVTDMIFRMIPAGVSNADIMNKVNAIFGAEYDDRFKHVIWGNDQYIKQVDLFKINHFDNGAKSTSLKMLENNMGMDNIQELPIKPNTVITAEQREEMYRYVWHDVAATLLFLSYNIKNIELRRTLGVKYNHDFTNASDSKIGSEIFKIKLKEAGLPVNQKTFRDKIAFHDCIFNYVGFERVEFKWVHWWLDNTVITQTKEALNDIDIPYGMAIHMNPELITVHGLDDIVLKSLNLRKGQKVKLSIVPEGEVLTHCTFTAEHLHIIVDGFQFDFGTGGIHGSHKWKTFRTGNGKTIKDVDVASYYPNLGIKNRAYPEHLGEAFCDVNEMLYDERGLYPKKEYPNENKAIKLGLNSAYGNSNSQYSFLYDPKYTMTITLNGQLLLCMLSEQLLKVPELEIIQINTDGVTYYCPDEYVEHTMNICRWWENISKGLVLEDVTYKSMHIRDVNNYIAVDDCDNVKLKGAYEYDLADQGLWHKNFNCLIVPMAAEQAIVNGVNPMEFIEEYLNKEEYKELFCMRSKADRNSKIVLDNSGVDYPLQRITRYYPSIIGGELVKVMPPTPAQISLYENGDHYMHQSTGTYVVKKPGVKPPSGKYAPVPEDCKRSAPDRRISIEAGCNVAVCNNLDNFNWENLNVSYYIDQVNKLVAPLL